MPNDLGVMRAALELESAAFIRELTKASTATSQATARMQASMAGLNKSFASAASGLKSFVAGFASVATVRAIAGIVSGVVDLGDEIGEASTKLGIGAEQLQRFRFAAAQADVGVGDLDNALKVFQQNFALGKAGVGGGSLIDGFDNLIKKIAEAPNEIEKVRIAQQALRRQFQTGLLLADQFGEAFKKSYKDAFVLSNQAVKNASDLDNQIKDLSNAVQAGFATGLLEEFNKGLALSHDDLVAINKQAEQFGHSLGGALKELAEGLRQFNQVATEAEEWRRKTAEEANRAAGPINATVRGGTSDFITAENTRRAENQIPATGTAGVFKQIPL
jgi:hypothetical protein